MPKDTKKSAALWATALCVVLQLAAVSALVDTYTAARYAGDGYASPTAYGPALTSSINSFAIRTNPVSGELFFIDGNCAISKVDSNGDIVLVSGDPSCGAGPILQKRGVLSTQTYGDIYAISFDSAGILYVAESSTLAGPVWKLDLAGNTATQVDTIDDVYQIAVSPDGTKLYYSTVHDTKVYELDLTGVAVDRLVYDGNFNNFVVSPDGKSLWGSMFGLSTVSQVNIATGVATVKVGSATTTFTGTPNGVTPGTNGVLPSFTSLSFDRRGNLVIGSDNHIFYYEITKDAFSLIAGNGASAFVPATDFDYLGPALQTPFFVFDVSASPNTDVIYVDFSYVDINTGVETAFISSIILDLSSVTITVAPASLAEDSASVATFTVTRSVAHSFPLTVNLVLSGNANPGTDYTVSGTTFASGVGTIVIPADATTATFTVDPSADTLYLEATETVTVTLGESSDYSYVSPSSATLTITNVAQANGDPHMIGFQGQVYDFIGEAHKIYNVLSDPALQVNMQLYLQRTGEHSFVPGPVMQKLGFATMHHQIVIDCGGSFKEEQGTVTIDGRQLAQDGSIALPDDKVTIVRRTLNTTAKSVGLGGNDHVVGSAHFVMEGLFEFTVYFIENIGDPHRPGVASDSKWYRRFLDFNSVLLDSERRPHGVLGQTAAPVSRERSLEDWTIEGSDSDYVIKDGLLGKKFSFNQFQ